MSTERRDTDDIDSARQSTVTYESDELPDEDMAVMSKPGYAPQPKAVRGERVGEEVRKVDLERKPGAKEPSKGVVSEYYSPPRVTQYAKEFGLNPGVSRDYTTGWDFSVKENREAARKEVTEGQFDLIVGSVMCRDWSIMQNINKKKMGPVVWEERMKQARIHL